METLFGLTQRDRDLFDEALARIAELRPDGPSTQPDDVPQASDVYLCLPPVGGIPRCRGNRPGYAFCEMYRLVDQTPGSDQMLIVQIFKSDGVTPLIKKVNNYSFSRIARLWTAAIKTKGKGWIAIQMPVAVGSSSSDSEPSRSESSSSVPPSSSDESSSFESSSAESSSSEGCECPSGAPQATAGFAVWYNCNTGGFADELIGVTPPGDGWVLCNEGSSSSSSSSEPSVSDSGSESESVSDSESDSLPSESEPSVSEPPSESDKSTAIVPASWPPGGYTALHVLETPDVRFNDLIASIPIHERETFVPIDPKYLEVCVPGSIVVIGAVPDLPVVVGASVVGGSVRIVLGPPPLARVISRWIRALFVRVEPDVVQIPIQLTAIRRGFLGHRFPDRTREQFDANERHIRSAYPGAGR